MKIFKLTLFLDTDSSKDTQLCSMRERGDTLALGLGAAAKAFFKLVLMLNLIILASEFISFIKTQSSISSEKKSGASKYQHQRNSDHDLKENSKHFLGSIYYSVR